MHTINLLNAKSYRLLSVRFNYEGAVGRNPLLRIAAPLNSKMQFSDFYGDL